MSATNVAGGFGYTLGIVACIVATSGLLLAVVRASHRPPRFSVRYRRIVLGKLAASAVSLVGCVSVTLLGFPAWFVALWGTSVLGSVVIRIGSSKESVI
jgi:hypothetical protein